jgi:hypothetical protein
MAAGPLAERVIGHATYLRWIRSVHPDRVAVAASRQVDRDRIVGARRRSLRHLPLHRRGNNRTLAIGQASSPPSLKRAENRSRWYRAIANDAWRRGGNVGAGAASGRGTCARLVSPDHSRSSQDAAHRRFRRSCPRQYPCAQDGADRMTRVVAYT